MASAQSSPRKGTTPNTHRSHCISTINAPQNRELFAKEMQNKFIHMPCKDFLATFVPTTDAMPQPPDFTAAFDGVDPNSGELELYGKFSSCIEDFNLCPNHKFVSTPYRFQADDPEKRKIDMGLYPVAKAPLEDGRPRWAYMALYVEVKTKLNEVACDPFDNTSQNEADAKTRRDTRGQIISYAAAMHARQHRTFSFSVLILGDSVRLLRWDRSGAVFTEKFNYRDEPEILGTFFWRFAHLPRNLQGYDLTATPVEKGTDDYKKMKGLRRNLPKKDYRREYFERSLANEEDWPLWKLSVETEEALPPSPEGIPNANEGMASGAIEAQPVKPKKIRYFLVGRPHSLAPGMVGRATRGYVALDCESGELVFLKDAWRVDLHGIEKEGNILRRLNQMEVKYVPTLVCHGDVGSQSTVTQGLWKKERGLDMAQSLLEKKDGVENPLKKHTHYRLVVKEIGRSLTEVADAFELVAVLCCALMAHCEAYTKARILHRDVSVGNILILPTLDADGNVSDNVTGLLNDWDLSKSLDAGPSPRQPDRTGTWQFMSGLLLEDAKKHHDLQDDLESLLHVLLWISIRYLKHNCEDIGSFMDGFFDSSFVACETVLGGRTKCGDLIAGSIKVSSKEGTIVQLRFDSPRIDHLVTTMLSWFSAHYRLHDYNHRVSKVSTSNNQSDGDIADIINRKRAAFSQSVGFFVPYENEGEDMGPPLSPDTEEKAAMLRDHGRIVRLFQGAVNMPGSAGDSVTADQLPKDFCAGVVTAPRTGDKRSSEAAGIPNSDRQAKTSKISGKGFVFPKTT